MKIETIGNYRMANGQKAVVLEIFEGMAFGRVPMVRHGCLTWNSNWWDVDTGRASHEKCWNIIDLWEEPEELVPHWPALIRQPDTDQPYVTGCIFPDEESAIKHYVREKFVRLAKEYPPVPLARVKK